MTGLWIFSETVQEWSCFLRTWHDCGHSGLSALQLCRWQRDFMKAQGASRLETPCEATADWSQEQIDSMPAVATALLVSGSGISSCTRHHPKKGATNINKTRCAWKYDVWVDMNRWLHDMSYHDSDVNLCYRASLKSLNPVFWQIWECLGAIVWLVTDFRRNHRLWSQATKRRTGLCSALVCFSVVPGEDALRTSRRLSWEALLDLLDGAIKCWTVFPCPDAVMSCGIECSFDSMFWNLFEHNQACLRLMTHVTDQLFLAVAECRQVEW